LSFAQRRLWFLDRVDPGRSHYNVSLVLRLSGAARLEPMEQALREIVRRHEVLRLAIPEVDGLPVPMLTAATDDVVRHEDVSHLPAAQRETEALRIALAAI